MSNKNDHLGKFLEDAEKTTPETTINPDVTYYGDNKRQKVDKIIIDDWINIPLKTLPYNKFYQTGTEIYIKALTTKEKQAFAVVNEDNPLDVSNKLNEVFQSCVKVILPGGEHGTYRDLMYGDQYTMSLALAKLSAKNGRKFEHTVKAKNGEEVTIEMVPANYVYKEEDELEEFFNLETKVYEIKNPSNGDVIKLAPPTIGIVEDLHKYLFKKGIESRDGSSLPSASFIECILYIEAGKGVKEIDIKRFEQLEYEFERLNGERFEVINDVVENYINFDITKIKAQSSTGEWVESPFRIPGGARNLFIVPNALKSFIGQ